MKLNELLNNTRAKNRAKTHPWAIIFKNPAKIITEKLICLKILKQ